MPIIGHFDVTTPVPLVILTGSGSISADAETAHHFGVILRGTSDISATLTGLLAPSAELAGTSSLFARGRVNADPNVFGQVLLTGTSSMTLNGRRIARGKVVIRGTSDATFSGDASTLPRSISNVALTILVPVNAKFGDTISARLTADGVIAPIRSATFAEPKNANGLSLECTLQKPSQRDEILGAESFKFEIYARGAWHKMFESGRRSGGSFAFAWVDAIASDSLSISTIGPVSEKLELSPRENLTVYDPIKEGLLSNRDYKPIWDTRGNLHFHELQSIAGLTLYDLFSEIFENRCGFAGYETDITNFPIRRAEFETTSTMRDGVAPHIGVFDPVMFVIDDIVWIVDSTESIPDDWATPYILDAAQYKTAQLNENVLNLDGYVVNYTDAGEFDYATDRGEDDEPEEHGTYGDPNYQEILRSRTFRDYFKFTDPFVPVRTEKIKETETIRAIIGLTLLDVATTIETINLDNFGRLLSIRKETTALIPNLAAVGFPFVEALIYRERTDFNYQPDMLRPGRQISAKTVKTIDGLITIDSTNQHLGRPFKQAYIDGFRAGNLSDSLTVVFGSIRTTIETTKQTDKGQLEIRTRTTDFLTTPPSVTNQTTDARSGDPSLNSHSGAPQSILVFKDEIVGRTTGKMQELSIGEMPVDLGIALARRKLLNDTRRTGSITLKGVELQFAKGFVFRLKDREGFAAGSYIIVGRQITLNELGTVRQNTTQVLDVQQIVDGGDNNQSLITKQSMSGAAGANVAFQMKLECKSGYNLSAASPDANVVIWAKAEPGDAFQNIVTTPIDLTPYALTTKTFYFQCRINGAAAGGQLVYQIIVSP